MPQDFEESARQAKRAVDNLIDRARRGTLEQIDIKRVAGLLRATLLRAQKSKQAVRGPAKR
jgi:hypothetical protein